MSARSTVAWAAVVGLAILLEADEACLAETTDLPSSTLLAPATNVNSNPYSVISERNVFHLSPPPPPPQPDKGPAVLPAVFLSGFMRAGGEAKALLAVKTQNPDPHAPELTSYVALAEGSKQGVGAGDKRAVVELVKIYLEQGKVDIIDSGTPLTLSLKEDGFNSAKAAPTGRKRAAAIHATPVVAPKPDEAPATDSAETMGIITGGDKPLIGPLFHPHAPPAAGEVTNNSNAIIVRGAEATTR